MNDDGINNFYENYIQNCKSIYIVSNLWDKKRKEQFLNKLDKKFNLTVFDDPVPRKAKWPTDKMNYIIMGKRR